ncbi:MAG: branched-chain amino acid ABC transporter permease [Candidatus Bathyarchaeia archaeon]
MILSADTILQLVVQSFLLGSIYVLMAVGLNVIYGVVKAINWAHGAFVMLGAYAAYWLYELYGISPYVAAIFSALALAVIGALTHELLMRPFFGMRYFRAITLVVTYGLAILLINITRYVWTDVLRGVNLGVPPVTVGAISVSRPFLYGGLVAIALSISFYLMLKRTQIGRAARAVSESRRHAMLVGINPNAMSRLMVISGAAMAGVTGSLISTIFAVTPEMGSVLGIKAITIVILGGLGSYAGALIGGLMIGFAEAFGTYFLGARYQPLLYFLTLLIVLSIKPTGIAGEE